MYRFLLRPGRIVAHVLVLALVVALVNLGLWQLRRLDEKRDDNARRRQRMALAAVPVDRLLQAGDGYAAGDRVADRRVIASGTYLGDQQVLVRGRSLDGAPGSWVVAPLRLDDGSVLFVNRGWMSNDGRFEAVPARLAPPSRSVEVEGLLQSTQTRSRFGPTEPAAGRLDSVARLDVARLDRQVPGSAVPAWLLLRRERPTPPARPRLLVPADTADEGPHFSYAVQWFAFSVIAAVGYTALLRRKGHELAEDRRRATSGRDPDGPDPDDEVAPDDPRLDDVRGVRDEGPKA